MGWGRTFFLGDIGNRLDIADVENEVTRIKRELRESGQADASQDLQIENLIRENAEVKLYLSAVVRLLLSKQILSEVEIKEIVNQLDSSDGTMDGRYDGPIA